MYRTGSNNTWDYNRVNFQVERFGGKLTETTEYRLDDYATTNGRGITIELLPLYAGADEEVIDDQHDTHDHVNFMISEGNNVNDQVYFSVIIFAVHEDQY
jgi:pantothenate kinase